MNFFPYDRSMEHFYITCKPQAGNAMMLLGFMLQKCLSCNKESQGLFTDTHFPNKIFIYFLNMTDRSILKFSGSKSFIGIIDSELGQTKTSSVQHVLLQGLKLLFYSALSLPTQLENSYVHKKMSSPFSLFIILLCHVFSYPTECFHH